MGDFLFLNFLVIHGIPLFPYTQEGTLLQGEPGYCEYFSLDRCFPIYVLLKKVCIARLHYKDQSQSLPSMAWKLQIGVLMKDRRAVTEMQNQNDSEARVGCFHEKLVGFRVENEGKLDKKSWQFGIQVNCSARKCHKGEEL